MKRVLFVFDVVAHYHAEMFRALERRLAARGIELHLASGEVPEQARGRVGLRHAVIAHERKYRRHETVVKGWTLRRAPEVQAIVRELRPAVVVCMAHVGHLAHWWLLRQRARLGHRVVAWQSGFEYHPGRLKAALLARFVPQFDHHLCYHGNARDYVLAHGGRAEQATVMHNTIDESRIECLPREAARRRLVERWPQLGDRRIVLFVGALLEEKRVELLIDAMDVLARPDLVLVVVGDGPHAETLRVRGAGRRDVLFAGAVFDGVGACFDAAEVFVLPGTGGLGLNEAMAHGLPMLASYADGSADDLVVDGETGFRLREGSANEIARRLAQLLDDPEAAARMGRTAAEWIRGRFAFARFVERIEAVLVAEVAATRTADDARPAAA